MLSVVRDQDWKRRPLLAEAALDRLLSPQVRAETRRRLGDFADRVPPNPRAMKKFVLDYEVLRAARILEGSTVERDTLARWVIFKTRWPELCDSLVEAPDLIRLVGAPDDETPDGLAEATRNLLASPDLLALVGAEGGYGFSVQAIRECAGVLDT